MPSSTPIRKISTDPVTDYARRVVAGKVIAGALARAACARHLRDLENGPARGLVWRPDFAAHYINVFSWLRHSKGEFAGQTLTLEPWQMFRVGSVYGWQRADGTRRFRVAYHEVARKNGKSTEAAGVGIVGLVADNEPGSEVYSAATRKEQARIVFDEACRMVRASPELRKKLRVLKLAIVHEAKSSKFEPLSSDARTLDGLNPHHIIVDELHKHSTRELLDVLDTALGARRQPVLWIITTAGDDEVETVYAQEREYAEKVLTGALEDDTYFAYIATIDAEDRWDDESCWIKANPNLGVSVKLDDMRRQCAKAKGNPSAQAAFKRLRLNVRTASAVKAIPMERWNDCHEAPLDEMALRGRPCFASFDLSSKIDLTAATLIFPPQSPNERWKLLARFWCPAENIQDREDRDRVQYQRWVGEGWVEATPGDVVDQASISSQILEWHRLYKIQMCPYDPWQATQLAIELQGAGVPVVEFIQGLRSYSLPTKEFLNLVFARKLEHGGNPILKWMASNLAVEKDKNENMMPTKKKSTGRIDGITAAIMAYGAALNKQEDPGEALSRAIIARQGLA